MTDKGDFTGLMNIWRYWHNFFFLISQIFSKYSRYYSNISATTRSTPTFHVVENKLKLENIRRDIWQLLGVIRRTACHSLVTIWGRYVTSSKSIR